MYCSDSVQSIGSINLKKASKREWSWADVSSERNNVFEITYKSNNIYTLFLHGAIIIPAECHTKRAVGWLFGAYHESFDRRSRALWTEPMREPDDTGPDTLAIELISLTIRHTAEEERVWMYWYCFAMYIYKDRSTATGCVGTWMVSYSWRVKRTTILQSFLLHSEAYNRTSSNEYPTMLVIPADYIEHTLIILPMIMYIKRV